MRKCSKELRNLKRYALALIICSACFREVSVNVAPLSILAISSVRSSPLISLTVDGGAGTNLFGSVGVPRGFRLFLRNFT